MARTSPRRVTRLDREAASQAAARMDLGPSARVGATLAVVAILVLATMAFVPSGGAFGGPLQGPVAGSASLTTIRRTAGDAVSLVVPVPWNAGTASAILDGVVPIEADGVQVKRAGVAPPGGVALQSQRGFPPQGVALLPVEGYTVAPGAGDLDGLRLVVGLSGEGTVAGFAVHYRVGGTSFVAILPDGALLCTADCEDRTGAEDQQRATIGRLVAFVSVADR